MSGQQHAPAAHFTPGKDPVPILQEAGWAPGPIWTDGKSRPHRDSIPDRPARSQSLYRQSYRAHMYCHKIAKITLIVRAIVLFMIIEFFEESNGSKYQIWDIILRFFAALKF